ncbi:MAG TPA: protein kinase [Gemmatimonadales bacterium]|nr:protein kinase [Gemmatimonadales bacterium]
MTFDTPLTTALADRYRIERELGQGGMAIVYLAEDVRHHRRVAIKVLHPQLSAVIGSERFLKEIELTANLQHPHILPLFDSGEAGGLLYYVMPYVEGETLRTRLERERQLSIPDAIRIAREVADALAYAHTHGVVHRDVKPENVLLHGNHALVADFGIALAVEEAGGSRMTQTGMSIGTPQYMAPEQAMGDRAADHRVDIYALGAVTYEMLVGEPPFTGLTSQAIVAKVMTEDPKGLVIQRRSIPGPVEAAVLTALEKLPADRFATATEFAQALTSAPAMLPRSAVPRAGLRRRDWFLTAAGGLALAAAMFWLGARVARPTPTPGFGRAAPVTWDYGLEVHPAVSPDGRLVAYAAGLTATNLRVFVRPVSGGRSVPLVEDSTQTQSSPRWSPDGTRVLFLSRGGAFSVPSFGGPPRQELAGRRSGAINWAAWAPDGERIAYAIADSIFLRETGGASRFVARAHELSLCSWSPDGGRLACASGNLQYALANQQFGNLSPSQLVVVHVSDGRVDTLTDRAASNQSPVWAGPGRLLFISNRHGPRDIYALDLDASGTARGEPVRLTTGLGAHTISLAADGRRIAYAAFSATSNIWALPIPSGGEAVSPYAAEQVTHGNQLVESFTVSPDGQWLLYDSNLAGNADLYRIPAAGGEPERLTTDPSDDFFPDLSPDGREVAFHSWRTGNREIFVLPLDGGPVQQVTVTPNRQEVGPKWSPDGRTLVYFEFEGPNDTLARGSVWTSRRDDQGAWSAPERRQARGNWPAWSPDGTRLVYGIGSVANRVHVAPAASGDGRLVYDAGAAGPGVEQLSWSTDARTLYFKSHDANGLGEIWAFPASGGPIRLVTRFDDPSRPSYRFNMAVGPRHFYFSIDERQSDVWVMDVTGADDAR